MKTALVTGNASISVSNKIDANFETQSINLVALDGFIKENELDLNIDYIKVIIEDHEDFFFKGVIQKDNLILLI